MICFILHIFLLTTPFVSTVTPSTNTVQVGSTLSIQYKVEYPSEAIPEAELLLHRIESERLFLPFNVLSIRNNISIQKERNVLQLDIDIQPLEEGKIKYSPGFLSFSTKDYLLLPECTVDVESVATAPLIQPFLLLNPEAALKLSAENRRITFVEKALQEGKRGFAVYELRTISWEALTLALLSICSCILIFWLLYEYDQSRERKGIVEVPIDWKLEFANLVQNKELPLVDRFDRLAYILRSSHALENREDIVLQDQLDEIRFANRVPSEKEWQSISTKISDILFR